MGRFVDIEKLDDEEIVGALFVATLATAVTT